MHTIYSNPRTAKPAEALLPVLDLLAQCDASAEFPLPEFKKRMVRPPPLPAVTFPCKLTHSLCVQAVLTSVIGSHHDGVLQLQQLQVASQ